MFDYDEGGVLHSEGSGGNRINRGESLKRFSQRQDDVKLEREALRQERERLLAEVRGLEDENHKQARQVKELQLQLVDRRETVQRLFQRVDELKKRIVQFLSQENNLIHEIRFLEAEKERCVEDYRKVSDRVNANMAAIAAILRDIGFMRGEMETLMEKTGYLERGVPDKFRDLDSLDEKISGSWYSLEELYNKLKAVDKNTKIIYYGRSKG